MHWGMLCGWKVTMVTTHALWYTGSFSVHTCSCSHCYCWGPFTVTTVCCGQLSMPEKTLSLTYMTSIIIIQLKLDRTINLMSIHIQWYHAVIMSALCMTISTEQPSWQVKPTTWAVEDCFGSYMYIIVTYMPPVKQKLIFTSFPPVKINYKALAVTFQCNNTSLFFRQLRKYFGLECIRSIIAQQLLHTLYVHMTLLLYWVIPT